ncbi:MAG: ComF family protein [Caldilineaceae bacterium]|nr:ComF family protein [Caldilineaceae bacterium]
MERCVRCREGDDSPLLMVRAAALHTHPLRPAIHEFKYENRIELADLLARYLVAAHAHREWHALPVPIGGVSPVPLHAERLASRGYNQSELLASAFCRFTGLTLRSEWIQRQRDTRPQVGLKANERRANVMDAFLATADLRGQAILLIDDVFTTGATLTACAAAAHDAGAAAVYALTLAMPVGGNPSSNDDVVDV